MKWLWRFLSVKRNREILAWIGTGLAASAAALWAVMIYLWPPHRPQEEPPASISTQGPQSPVVAQSVQTQAPCGPVGQAGGAVTFAYSGGCTSGIGPDQLKEIIDSVLAKRAIPPDL